MSKVLIKQVIGYIEETGVSKKDLLPLYKSLKANPELANILSWATVDFAIAKLHTSHPVQAQYLEGLDRTNVKAFQSALIPGYATLDDITKNHVTMIRTDSFCLIDKKSHDYHTPLRNKFGTRDVKFYSELYAHLVEVNKQYAKDFPSTTVEQELF